jgi:hypothetical protein
MLVSDSKQGYKAFCVKRSGLGAGDVVQQKQNREMKSKKTARTSEQGEQAMIAGILEGSPDAVGVAVVRLDCGCRKMAAVNAAGEPASKIIMYRDKAESICPQCQQDNGSYMRVLEQFISWKKPEPDERTKQLIAVKALGREEELTH